MSTVKENETREGVSDWIRTTNTGICFNVNYLLSFFITNKILFNFSFSTKIFRYEPEDQLEWQLVLDEIKGFIKAESAVAVLHADSNPIILSHRWVFLIHQVLYS